MKTTLTSVFAKTMEAQHGLASAVLLCSACACVFSLVFRFLLPQRLQLAVPRRLVGATAETANTRVVMRLITFKCLVTEAQ